MKKIYSFIFCITFFMCMQAQMPNLISYQAVVRIGEQNKLVTNTSCGVKISILNENNVAVYVETHSVFTNANGLLTLSIGAGSAQVGSFTAVDWANGPYFIKTEIDPSGGSNYLLSSTTQLLTVPYAFYAKSAENISGTIPYDKITGAPVGFTGNYNDLTDTPTLFSGSYNDLTDKPDIFSGEYNDLSGKPAIKDSILRYGFNGDYRALTNTPEPFSGSYNDLTDRPTLGDNGFSGAYNDLSGKPAIKDSILRYGFSGDYNDLANQPTFFSGNYLELTNKPPLFSGSYNDLTDLPASFSGDYNNLANKPNIKDSIATFGFDGNYNSLTNKPNINIKDSIATHGFNGNYNNLTNKPSIKDSIDFFGFNGDYNSLDNKPTKVSVFSNDANYVNLEQLQSRTVPEGTTVGDLLYWDGNEGWEKLPVGTEGQILSVVGGKPAWIDFDSSKNTYKVGDIYLIDDNPLGIVAEISSDGESGILISLDEFTNKTWGRNDTLISASEADGYLNTNKARAVWNYNATTYPAFAACVDLGADEWYLPSREEMIKVYENRSEINAKLQLLEKTQLTADAYWTSTEKDAANAYLLQFNTIGTHFKGTAFEVKKDSTLAVRPMRKLTKNELKSRPDGYYFYKVGDVYYENNVPTGVVYEISGGGLHGKVLALTEERKSWSLPSKLVTKAVSDDNGLENADSIRANVPAEELLFHSILMVNDWYAPAKNELAAIYNQKDVLNTTLNQLQNATTLNVTEKETKFYWSSTEKDAENAYVVSFEDGSVMEISKATNGYIRGIKNF